MIYDVHMNNVYDNLTEMADFLDRCCGEQMWLCPDCHTPVCVFCQSECNGCYLSVF